MKLSVVIVNYNVKDLLEQCLISVYRACERIESYEIFVVDNDSSDGSVEYLRPRFPAVHFIANKDNVGYSRANNQAIRLSEGEYILLLNPDTLVGENVFYNVLRFMDTHPDAGCSGVKMIDTYGRFHPESKRSFPTPWNSLCKMTGLSKLFPMSSVFAKYHLLYLDKDAIHEIDVISGAFMMFRKETLDRIGLLDEKFFMYGEDIDISYRVLKANYKNYYLPFPILHYKGESTKKDSFKYVQIFYGAMLIFFRKHYPHYNFFFTFMIKLAIFSRAGVACIKRIFKNAFRFKREQNSQIQEFTLNVHEYDIEEMFQLMTERIGVNYKIDLRSHKINIKQ
ncbi:MAG: glycosyltransferase family 2 protein [Bacteroidales bacterium]